LEGLERVAPGAEGVARVREVLGDCHRCRLATGRIQIVFGQGDPRARLMFIGEGPGRDEDLAGEAFVGAAGKLLTKMIAAMGQTREQVYIANVIKCRPPRNRDPEPNELEACEPFIVGQIRAIDPAVIVTLGRVPAQALLRSEAPVGRLRGRFHALEVEGRRIPLMPTYHPAYLLRNPEAKRPVWEDLKQVIALLEERREG
jgi:DNA polymerase